MTVQELVGALSGDNLDVRTVPFRQQVGRMPDVNFLCHLNL